MTTTASARRGRPGRHALHLSLTSMLGRARADWWPLLVMLTLIAATTFLTCVSPALVSDPADDAVRAAVATDPSHAQVSMDTGLFEPFVDVRGRLPETATEVHDLAGQLDRGLPGALRRRLAPPVATVTSIRLRLTHTDRSLGDVSARVAYVWQGGEAPVTWLDGRRPDATGSRDATTPAPAAGPWPVQVALSEQVARTLHLRVGQRLPAVDGTDSPMDLRITGIFRPVDPRDPRWQRVPDVLEPQVLGLRVRLGTQVAVLVSGDSLPDARLAFPLESLTPDFTWSAQPGRFDADIVEPVLRAIAAVQLRPGAGADGERVTFSTGLDSVLLAVRDRIRAVEAQMAVLLAGGAAAAALAIVLAARLLVRRRARVLTTVRARGAGLPTLAAELTVESILVAAAGAAIGLAAGSAAGSGSVDLRWFPLIVGPAVLAGPLFALALAARATAGRVTDRGGHVGRLQRRDRQLRRGAVELVVLLAAAAAFVSLRHRGISTGAGGGGTDLLVSSAPALVALAGAVVLLRGVPPLLHLAVVLGRRSRRAVPLLAPARAAASSGAGLPVLALTVAVSLSTFAFVTTTTIERGQRAGSWDAVGADAVVTTADDPGLPAVARQVATRPGVTRTMAGRADSVPLQAAWGGHVVRLLVVPAAQFRALLAASPGHAGGPTLPRRLASDGTLPALLSPDLLARGTTGVSVLWQGDRLPLRIAGTAPTLGADPDGTVLVDASAFAAAAHGAAAPNTLWVIGSGARAAVAGTPSLAGAPVVDRAERLRAQRADPLVAGFLRLTRAAAWALLALAVLVLVLSSTGSAPERGRALAVLRTLGLAGPAARRVSFGELLPVTLLAALVGDGLGVAIAAAVRGPLALRLATGQAGTPEAAVPWTVLAPLLSLLVTTAAVVAVESSVRRRERLGQVLRAGGS